MKLLLLSQSDMAAGAARAAYRLHQALQADGHDSRMLVRRKVSNDPTVETRPTALSRAVASLRKRTGSLINQLGHDEPGTHSGNWLPSRWAEKINASGAEVVNLHWVGGETLSIPDISRIRAPLVWTLHDMWTFCGVEHYASDAPEARWRTGYRAGTRPSGARGFDLERAAWQRKKYHWTRRAHVITPSCWLADCARESALLADWDITSIPNPLDTTMFQPLDRRASREALNLPAEAFLVVFGAIGSNQDPRKGFDLLAASLACLAERRPDLPSVAVVFGQSEPADKGGIGLPSRWLGHINQDTRLAQLYSAADVVVVPSRQENLPQVATEAQACGCPVVAFDCSGFPDAVEHGVTGYLARAFEPEGLAAGIGWVADHPERLTALRMAARARAERLWAPDVVLPQYLEVYAAASQQGGKPQYPERE